MNHVQTTLIVALIILYLLSITMSYIYYVSSDTNRYRFRYWGIVSWLNIMQLLIYSYCVLSGNQEVSVIRYLLFTLINVYLLEIFMYTFKHRSKEMVIRFIYIIILLLYWILNNNIFILFGNAVILAHVSMVYGPELTKKHFMVTFWLYSIYIIIPKAIYLYFPDFKYNYLTELITVFLYSSHLTYGIYKIYKSENIEDDFFKNLLNKA